MPTPAPIFTRMQSFEHTPPEARELLSRPIRDLGLRLEGSMLEKYVQQLYGELAAKGLALFRPAVYLSDEWACPDREPIIGVPFYLADPKIAELERVLNDLEDEREIRMYLRHEAGHAFNYACQLYETKEWLDLFGPFDRPYLDDYKPVAVWLTPDSDWQRRYGGWPALRKLKYVDRMELPVEEMRDTIEQYYREHQREQEVALGDVPDSELEDIFVRRGEDLRPAAAFLVEHRKTIVDKITFTRRARELELSVDRKGEPQTL